MNFFREGSWLTRERVVAYARLSLVAYAAALVVFVVNSHGGIDAQGEPIGMDFHCFWSAGVQALSGTPADAYDLRAHHVQQSILLGRAPASSYPFLYPPPFLMLMMPLALLPYAVALLLWVGAGMAAYACCMRRIVVDSNAALIALALPGSFVNVLHGQNAYFTSALLGAGLLLLEARPVLAGVLFGLLCMKPQVALLVPVALIAGRHWRPLLAMSATLAAIAASATVLMGNGVWPAFAESMQVARALLELPPDVYYGRVTVFETLRLAGIGQQPALVLQACTAAAAVATVIWAWRTPARLSMKSAVLAAATLLATPHAFAYDLLVPSLAAAWLVAEGLRTGFRPYEASVIFGLALMPLVAPPLATGLWFQPVPLLLMVLLWVCTQRLRWQAALEKMPQASS